LWGRISGMSQILQNTARAFKAALSTHAPKKVDNNSQARTAAVLMPLWEDGGQAQVVFTKRTESLPTHAGQISFPGGATDPDDPDLAFTALRETCEEIGVCLDSARVVVQLDQMVTVSNFLVTPFVGVLEPEVEFTPNPEEVERLVVVPLAKVLDPNEYKPTRVTWQGMELMYEALCHNGDIIWGATARILMNLLDRLGDSAGVIAAAGLGQDPKRSGQ
jgi:8-oxo-dGTP pyrophosphatase MutT (NUDIX family)